MFNIYVVYKCFPKMREAFVERLEDYFEIDNK